MRSIILLLYLTHSSGDFPLINVAIEADTCLAVVLRDGFTHICFDAETVKEYDLNKTFYNYKELLIAYYNRKDGFLKDLLFIEDNKMYKDSFDKEYRIEMLW